VVCPEGCLASLCLVVRPELFLEFFKETFRLEEYDQVTATDARRPIPQASQIIFETILPDRFCFFSETVRGRELPSIFDWKIPLFELCESRSLHCFSHPRLSFPVLYAYLTALQSRMEGEGYD